MQYKVIGMMSGSSLDGLDLAYIHFTEEDEKWSFRIIATSCLPYPQLWQDRLKQATQLKAFEYHLLHCEYGEYVGVEILKFIQANKLEVDFIVSHGHTTFHEPQFKMTSQLGSGAHIAALVSLPVINDLRIVDMAYHGQGAPIVPMGEKLLFADTSFFLNIGGIANVSINNSDRYLAFDVCPANSVLNYFAQKLGREYDDGGALARQGVLHTTLLETLSQHDFYTQKYPKSLSNQFAIQEVLPLIQKFDLSIPDILQTYCEHVSKQIAQGFQRVLEQEPWRAPSNNLMVSGGGALNTYLFEKIKQKTAALGLNAYLPDVSLIHFKEALIMGLIGVLRWRQQNNVLASATGAIKNSVNGCIWYASKKD